LASVAVVGLFAAGCREAAPDFAGTTLDGRAVTLGDYLGRPLILAFMADWCGACRTEASELDRFYRETGQGGAEVAVLAAAWDTTAEAMRVFMEEGGYSFPVMVEPEGLSSAYGIDSIPSAVVIDAEGRIAKTFTGRVTAAELSRVVGDLAR
jgi:peroxiredoxin